MSDCFVLYTLMQGIVCKEQYTPMAWQQHHCACCMFPLHLPPPPPPPAPASSSLFPSITNNKHNNAAAASQSPPPVTVAHVARGLLAQCPPILICVNQVLYLHLAYNWDSPQA